MIAPTPSKPDLPLERAKRGDGEIGAVGGLDDDGARADVLVVVFVEEIGGVVPQVEGADLGAEAAQDVGRAVLALEVGP